jgi:hypothetical protein
MYAEFEQFEPGLDRGIDLAQEYEMAESLTREESMA